MGWHSIRIAAVAAGLLLPAAPATALTTTITAPVPGTRLVVDEAAPPTVHLEGTASSGASVDVLCVSQQSGEPDLTAVPIAEGVPVDKHAFAADATWPADPGLCEVYAVAPGTVPTAGNDLNGLQGSLVYEAATDSSSADGKVYDYDTFADGADGAYGMGSFGACPVSFGELARQHDEAASIFDCNGYLEASDPTSATDAPSLVVDGEPAYTTFTIGDDETLSLLPGWYGLTYAVSDDAGTFHVTSHEEIYRCADVSCLGFAMTGLAANVDERLSPDGRVLVQQLRIISEDGRQHLLSAVLNQTTADARQWRFPGAGGFQDYAIGAAPSVIAPAVATIRNRVANGTPDPDISTGFGAITYAVKPSAEVFWDPGDAFTQRYPARVVPAGRAIRFQFVYSMAAGSADLNAQAGAAEASIAGPPSISVTSAGAANSPAYTLTGSVTAPETLSALTVNEQPVTAAPDGAFAVRASLGEGTNTFTVRASDELGRIATKVFTVALTTPSGGGPPPPPPLLPPPPPSVVFDAAGKPVLKRRVLTTGLTATCPGLGPDCTVSARVRAAGHANTRVVAVAQDGSAAIKVTLTRAAAKRLRRRHKLGVGLMLTGMRTGADTSTLTRSLTLTSRRHGRTRAEN